MILEDPEGALLARFAGGWEGSAAPGESGEEKGAARLPAAVWSAFGGEGIPFRMRISDLGPALLTRLLQLTEPQEALLAEAFAAADREGLLLDDAADLAAYLAWYAEMGRRRAAGKPNAGVAARIEKRLEALCRSCGRDPFGTPEVSPWDFLLSDGNGRGTLHFAEGRESGPCLLFLLAAMAQRFPERRETEGPVLAAVLREKTAEAAEEMRSPLEKRGILLLREGRGGELEEASFLPASFKGALSAPLPGSVPQEGGAAGILERTLRLPLAARLRDKEALCSAREALAAGGEGAESPEAEKEESEEKAERGRRRENGAWHDVGRSVAGTVGRQIGEDVGRNFGDFGRRLGGNLGASLGRGLLSTLLRH